MNTKDAAYHTVHDYAGGSESLGPRVGISAAVLRNKVNPNNETHHLTLAEAQRIVDFTDDDRMLKAWAHQRGYILLKAREGSSESDMSVLEQVAALAMAKGHFMGEIYKSLADGGVDAQEFERIESAGQDVMAAVAGVKQRMRGMVG